MSIELAQVNDSVHHLGHAEAVSKVVKRVVAVIGLNAKLVSGIERLMRKSQVKARRLQEL